MPPEPTKTPDNLPIPSLLRLPSPFLRASPDPAPAAINHPALSAAHPASPPPDAGPAAAVRTVTDAVQQRLDSVNRRLGHPTFLRNITASQLPSQSVSASSLSPSEDPLHGHHWPGHLPLRQRGPSVAPAGPGGLVRSPLRQAFEPAGEEEPVSWPSEGPSSSFELERAILELDFKGGEDSHLSVDIKRVDVLQKAFLAAWLSLKSLPFTIAMATDRGFTTFDHGHNDLVLAVDFNFYGTRMVTASSDHRLKVWDKKDDTWTLIDTWRGHDAEVVDVKWNGPFTGSIIGSVGEDGKFNLWEEDVLEPPLSARRFKKIWSIRSETKIPFCSLDFKNLNMETYAALITRDGYLSVYEPADHDDLSGEWSTMMQKYVCPIPPRQNETGFRAAWHKEKVPCWTAVEAGLDKRALSLAVAAMNTVKIFRTDKERKWYQAAELTGARAVIRDVAWANGSMRGYDILATASKDGAVRIYEVSTTPGGQVDAPATPDPFSPSGPPPVSGRQARAAQSSSGIGASLAGSSTRDLLRDLERHAPGQVRHVVKMVAELTAHGGSVWQVAFSQLGELNISAWRRLTLDIRGLADFDGRRRLGEDVEAGAQWPMAGILADRRCQRPLIKRAWLRNS
jgi:nucleoporin SEH1